jgi:hypothetical protein
LRNWKNLRSWKNLRRVGEPCFWSPISEIERVLPG